MNSVTNSVEQFPNLLRPKYIGKLTRTGTRTNSVYEGGDYVRFEGPGVECCYEWW